MKVSLPIERHHTVCVFRHYDVKESTKELQDVLLTELEKSSRTPGDCIGLYPTLLIDPAILPLRQRQSNALREVYAKNNRRYLRIESDVGIPAGAFGRLSICYLTTLFKKKSETLGFDELKYALGETSISGLFKSTMGKQLSGQRQYNEFYQSFLASLSMGIRSISDSRFANGEDSQAQELSPFDEPEDLSNMQAIPVDVRALRYLWLTQRPLAIDLYLFIIFKGYHRFISKKRLSSPITWSTLKDIFQNESSRCKSLLQFKRRIRKAVRKVIQCLPGCNIFLCDKYGLFLNYVPLPVAPNSVCDGSDRGPCWSNNVFPSQ